MPRVTKRVLIPGKIAPDPRGRPRKEIDLDLVSKLATIHCTDREIAFIVGVAPDTFSHRKAKDPEFAEMLEVARSKGKASLRRKQWHAAEQGNVTMLIFLGKNYLSQRDRFDEPVADKDPLPWQD